MIRINPNIDRTLSIGDDTPNKFSSENENDQALTSNSATQKNMIQMKSIRNKKGEADMIMSESENSEDELTKNNNINKKNSNRYTIFSETESEKKTKELRMKQK